MPKAIAECRDAGIRVVMITGDYPATAQAIARAAGLGHDDVLAGPELSRMSDGEFADRVREALADRSFLGRDGEVVTVTCSFGVAQHTAGDHETELFASADRALYRAKREGKNRVETAAPIRS